MKLRKTLVLIPLLLAMSTAAQAAPPHHGRDKAPPAYAMQAPVQGTVQQYLLNPHGEVDGLLLADGTQVKFPPHLGEELAALAQPGSVVDVNGYRESAATVKAYSVTANGSTLVDRPPQWHQPRAPKHWRDMMLSSMSAQGTVQHLLYGKHGEVKGAVLDNGTIVRVPGARHHGYMLASVLRVGETVSVQGYGTENAYGRVVEAAALSANGQTHALPPRR